MGQAPKLPEKARAPAGQVFTMAEVEKHDSAASAWFVHSNKVRFYQQAPRMLRHYFINVSISIEVCCHVNLRCGCGL